MSDDAEKKTEDVAAEAPPGTSPDEEPAVEGESSRDPSFQI
jgi:hypothetical protein